jgi:hypothetical protein
VYSRLGSRLLDSSLTFTLASRQPRVYSICYLTFVSPHPS